MEEPVTALVLFDFDQSVLRGEARARLDELGARFKDGAFDRIDAFGYADRIGSDAYNMRLSSQRAETVRGYLVNNGVDSEKINTEARGERGSVTGDDCRNMGAENRENRKLIECLQPDRRVRITLVPAR
jgi:OOP family OmpA-OmpF porin